MAGQASIAQLCLVGPVTEEAERAARTAAGGGPKARRAQHAAETLRAITEGGYDIEGERVELAELMLRAVDGSEFFPHERRLQRTGKASGPTTIEVRCCTTLAAAQELAAEGTPGVLNFASARNPGGGFSTGAEAQEESLARSSGIYPCLTKFFQEFFVPHRNAASGVYSHSLIHSPGVPVIRDEAGELLPQPYLADFVTAAAPNCGVLAQRRGWDAARAEAGAVFRERMLRVLTVFAAGGSTDLVLGAWGCGVFKNDPVTVASLFREALGHFGFRRVIFAVLDPHMAQQFQHVLGGGAPVAAPLAAAESAPGHAPREKGGQKGQNRKAKRWQKTASNNT